MNKKDIEQIKQTLEKQKDSAKQELLKFAKKDDNLEGDWDTKFPDPDGGAGGEVLEDLAKRREEYENLLPVEFALEKKIKNIEIALKKIKKGEYGKCEKCKKKIPNERLLAIPEARSCIKCQKNR
ncbi:MAG: TraR/DksA family transcriptional regulator [Candidatus Pacebacteria bacterium]|nr:TraR/DksA family transcriptional regulator [Candidatus Paceibacterota bacterium]